MDRSLSLSLSLSLCVCVYVFVCVFVDYGQLLIRTAAHRTVAHQANEKMKYISYYPITYIIIGMNVTNY